MTIPLRLSDLLTREEEKALYAHFRRHPERCEKARVLGVLTTLTALSRSGLRCKPVIAEIGCPVSDYIWSVLSLCAVCQGRGYVSRQDEERWKTWAAKHGRCKHCKNTGYAEAQ